MQIIGVNAFIITPATRAASSENAWFYDGSASGVYFYAYVHNNPINFNDPNGLWAKAAATWVDTQKTNYWGDSQDPRPAQLTYNWATGTGPANYAFDSNSLNTAEMQAAPGVANARNFLYNKYDGSPPQGGSVDGYKASFGLNGLTTANTLAEQFVGSYSVNIKVSNGQANFTLFNNSSFQSFFYGIGPNWERSTFAPMGNMRQTYSWSEPLRVK